MDRATLNIETESAFRASEILGDLKIVAETLYFPMRVVGFWDEVADSHMCPETEIARPCPHKLAANDPSFVPIELSMERLKLAVIEVVFPHAKVRMFLS